LCGRKIAGGSNPDHFAPWNVFGCPSMQMQEDLRLAGRSNQAQEAIQCVYRISYACFVPLVAVLLLSICIAYAAFTVVWFIVIGAIIFALVLPFFVVSSRFQTEADGASINERMESISWISCAPLALLLFCCGGDSD